MLIYPRRVWLTAVPLSKSFEGVNSHNKLQKLLAAVLLLAAWLAALQNAGLKHRDNTHKPFYLLPWSVSATWRPRKAVLGSSYLPPFKCIP